LKEFCSNRERGFFSMKHIASVFLCLLVSSFASLASAEPLAYIDMGEGFFDRPAVVVNNKRIDAGFWTFGFNLSAAMAGRPEAAEWAAKHERAIFHAGVGYSVGIGGAITYAAFVNTNSDVGIFLGILLAGLLYGGYNQKLAQSYLFKAINSYNGVVSREARFSVPVLNYEF